MGEQTLYNDVAKPVNPVLPESQGAYGIPNRLALCTAMRTLELMFNEINNFCHQIVTRLGVPAHCEEYYSSSSSSPAFAALAAAMILSACCWGTKS